ASPRCANRCPASMVVAASALKRPSSATVKGAAGPAKRRPRENLSGLCASHSRRGRQPPPPPQPAPQRRDGGRNAAGVLPSRSLPAQSHRPCWPPRGALFVHNDALSVLLGSRAAMRLAGTSPRLPISEWNAAEQRSQPRGGHLLALGSSMVQP